MNGWVSLTEVEQLAQKVRAKRGHTDHMLSRAQTQFDEAARLLEEKKRLESRTNAEIDALKAELEAEQDNALSMSLNLREAAKTAVEQGNEQAAALGFIISCLERVEEGNEQAATLGFIISCLERVEEGNEQAATLGFIISSQEKVLKEEDGAEMVRLSRERLAILSQQGFLASRFMLALDEEHDTLASEKATKASRITEAGV
ncbi:hypothetical protein T484DRAFT_1856151 [Baffinella frigidus]|nr:hypothetical protein T484DRAFT_1856151 [Cryptophyta sp. CCMP2293]